MHADGVSAEMLSQLRDMQVADEDAFDKKAWLEQHEPSMQARLQALDINQVAIDKLLVEMSQERQALEIKYEALLGPHYKSRMDIVSGETVQDSVDEPQRGIPGFWLKVLQTHPEIEAIITEKDAMVLHYLVGIVGSRSYPNPGDSGSYSFTLKFSFTPNEFFCERELSLMVTFADEDETIVKRIAGTKISWNSHGKDPTVRVKKKVGAAECKKVKLQPTESFFTLFNSIEPPHEDIVNAHEYDKIKQEAEDCLAIAIVLLEEIIPHAFKYYSGEKRFDTDLEDSTEYDDGEDGDADEEDEGQRSRGDDIQATCDVEDPAQDCKQQ